MGKLAFSCLLIKVICVLDYAQSDTAITCSDILFQWNDRKCTKAHFQSLRENKMVETTVIDTWSYILNINENLCSDSSPLRLFLTTETLLVLPCVPHCW